MNESEKSIMEEYEHEKSDYHRLDDIVHEILYKRFKTAEVRLLSSTSRVKTAASLEGKLRKHPGKYQKLSDLTDILGVRIITFYSDEVDVAGRIVEELFEIDWDNSIDKRKLMNTREFGYMSLHYIASLKNDGKNPGELCSKKFEIQIRTGLQHIWAEIEHDIGYKGMFSTDRNIARHFAQLAGLLEIADKEFLEIRDTMKTYTRNVRQKILLGELEDIELNTVSLGEYMRCNVNMNGLLNKILGIDGAELFVTGCDSFVEPLHFLGIENLVDLDGFVKSNSDKAFTLAEKSLSGLELDILSSSVTLNFLCFAELIGTNMSGEKAREFFTLLKKSDKNTDLEMKRLEKYREWLK